MKREMSVVLAFCVLVLMLLACGVNINLPDRELKTGPVQIEAIQIPIINHDVIQINLKFGAGELILNPGAQGLLIDGIAVYNVPDFSPIVTIGDQAVEIKTGDLKINGIPNFEDDIQNKWDLKIATVPIILNVQAGAYRGHFDFGGLAISNLELNDGASNVELTFGLPNLWQMEKFEYSTGASQVKMTKLANANFRKMSFRSGAGNYLLDFSGILSQDAEVYIESGISRMEIVVPGNTTVELIYSGKLTNISYSGTWEKQGSNYYINGTTPKLTIEVEMGAGELILKN
jgi:N-terminal domain of toast_rack, DUF2154